MAAILGIVGVVLIGLSVGAFVRIAPGMEVLPLRWDSTRRIVISTVVLGLALMFAVGLGLLINGAIS